MIEEKPTYQKKLNEDNLSVLMFESIQPRFVCETPCNSLFYDQDRYTNAQSRLKECDETIMSYTEQAEEPFYIAEHMKVQKMNLQ